MQTGDNSRMRRCSRIPACASPRAARSCLHVRLRSPKGDHPRHDKSRNPRLDLRPPAVPAAWRRSQAHDSPDKTARVRSRTPADRPDRVAIERGRSSAIQRQSRDGNPCTWHSARWQSWHLGPSAPARALGAGFGPGRATRHEHGSAPVRMPAVRTRQTARHPAVRYALGSLGALLLARCSCRTHGACPWVARFSSRVGG